ncbi:hypothetical protein Hanom_Chr03g00265661 [Helianthus anomalus]
MIRVSQASGIQFNWFNRPMEGLQEEYYYEGIPRQHFFNTHMPTTQFHQFSYVPK